MMSSSPGSSRCSASSSARAFCAYTAPAAALACAYSGRPTIRSTMSWSTPLACPSSRLRSLTYCSASADGTTVYPSRSAGPRVFEKVLTPITCSLSRTHAAAGTSAPGKASSRYGSSANTVNPQRSASSVIRCAFWADSTAPPGLWKVGTVNTACGRTPAARCDSSSSTSRPSACTPTGTTRTPGTRSRTRRNSGKIGSSTTIVSPGSRVPSTASARPLMPPLVTMIRSGETPSRSARSARNDGVPAAGT